MENTNDNNELLDILGLIELPDEIIKKSENTFIPEKMVTSTFIMNFKSIKKEEKNITISEKIETKLEKTVIKIETQSRLFKQFIHTSIFGIKYILTSAMIFGVLIVGTNFSAYSNILQSYIFEESNKKIADSLLNSVNAGKITEKELLLKNAKSETIKGFKEKSNNIEKNKNSLSIKQILSNSSKNEIDLGINIVPYENRIVIPRIGKNIPLIEIKEKTVESRIQLDDILMKELENGVVRYPGSAKPGRKGNSFIFGHSSNFPWLPGEYNDVFARLGQVEVGDYVFSYYNQKKFKYRVVSKKVVKPTDVGVLKNDGTKKELTLMTCWPIGTTLNRLIIKAELVEE